MNYELLETEIVERLLPFAIAGITVKALPETEAENSSSKNLPTKATFTVIYAGSEYPSLNSTYQVSQTENVFVSILIESTFLRGSLGIYNLISVLKKALLGFKPTDCQKITVVKHHTIGTPEAQKINNMWNYQVIFQTTSVCVEDFEEDLSIILKKITLVDGNENTVIPPETN